MPPDEVEKSDPGLARARTSLAWTRTAVAVAAVGGAILKRDIAVGVAVLAMSPLIWALGRLPVRAAGLARPRRLLVMTLAIIAVAVAALVVSFVGPGSPSR
jgi:uncharacterized membrane protein YidH (DUF202 family)